jgi:hypothetical protein
MAYKPPTARRSGRQFSMAHCAAMVPTKVATMPIRSCWTTDELTVREPGLLLRGQQHRDRVREELSNPHPDDDGDHRPCEVQNFVHGDSSWREVRNDFAGDVARSRAEFLQRWGAI